MTRLKFAFLGGFQVVLNDQPIRHFYSKNAQALLIYLVTEARKLHERYYLASLLWPDLTDTQALHNLRQTLSKLRRTLHEAEASESLLQVERTTICVNANADFSVDVITFLTLLDQATPDINRIEQAVTLYDGEFLYNFGLPDSSLFLDWFVAKQALLQQMALNGMKTLADHYLSRDYGQAAYYARQQLVVDSLQEGAYRQLMQALVGLGQRSAALAQYERCRQILDAELGVEPETETAVLYQAILSGTFATPTLVTKRSRLHNIPSAIAPLVGREAEIEQLQRIFSSPQSRLATLTGPGGVGKTRLSQAFGEFVVNHWPSQVWQPNDGVFFVTLSTVETADDIPLAIADSLKTPLSGSEAMEESVFNYLYRKQMLLILDNLEHLPLAPHFVRRLLQATQQLRVLITSRLRLNIIGEQVVPLEGLLFPRKKEQLIADSAEFSAVSLFVQIARQVNREFTLTNQTQQVIAQICQLVDGLPLGIELAATWTRVLPLIDIKEGIEQDLDFLTHSQQRFTQRHTSLRAVFNYSWSLLTDIAQNALLHLAVFRGGFDYGAAKKVAAASLSLLANLLDHSWLQRTAVAESRFEMLDIVRRFVIEKLGQLQQQATQAREKHARYYATFLQAKTTDLKAGTQKQTLTIIGIEIKNIQAAWTWAVQNQDWQLIDMLLEGLFHFYDIRSWFQEGKSRFEQVLSELPVPSEATHRIVHAHLSARLGWFAFHVGQIEQSLALLTESLIQLRELGDETAVVFTLNYLGAVKRHQGEQMQAADYYEDAKEYLHEALELAQQIEDNWGASMALNTLGQVASLTADHRDARQFFQQSMILKRQIGDRWGLTYSLTYLGRIAQAMGDYKEAQSLLQESLNISREFDDKRGLAFALYNLGNIARDLKQEVEAQKLFEESLHIFQAIGNQRGEQQVLAGMIPPKK